MPLQLKLTRNYKFTELAFNFLFLRRYLATGDSQQTIAFNFRVGRSTVCKIIAETLQALYEVLEPVYMKPPASHIEWLKIAKEYEELWNFPMCIGSLDGKHVVIEAPPNSGSDFF